MKRSVFVLAGAAAIVAGSILAAQQPPRRQTARGADGLLRDERRSVTAETSAVSRGPTRTARSSPPRPDRPARARGSGAPT